MYSPLQPRIFLAQMPIVDSIFAHCLKVMARLCLGLLLGLTAPLVQSVEIDLTRLSDDNQAQFKRLTRDLYQMIAYQDSQPAVSKASLSPFGFELGASVSSYELRALSELAEVGFDDTNPIIILPRLVAAIDIYSLGLAATYTKLYEGVELVGLKAKYRLLSGNALLPALAIGIHWVNLNGVETLDAGAVGVDVGVSKGFPLVTVYADLGYSQAQFEVKNTQLNFEQEDHAGLAGTLGARLEILGVANIGLQLRHLDGANSYTINVGLGF